MLLPQRPYIPIGPLREALAYPAASSTFSDEELRGDAEKGRPWRRSPTGSTKAKIGRCGYRAANSSGSRVARALLAEARLALPRRGDRLRSTRRAKPTSIASIAATLPQTTIVSIGHTLDAERLPQAPDRVRGARGRAGDDRRGPGAGGLIGASAQSERASRIVPRGPLITRSPLTRSHSGLPRSPDRKPISNALRSLLGHSFLVSA